MKKISLLLVLLIILVAAIPAAGQEGPDLQTPTDVVNSINASKNKAVYLVLMRDDPVIAYDGNIGNLQATQPAEGEKIDPDSYHVLRYTTYIKAGHNRAMATAGVNLDAKIYDYVYSLNGFVAQLTEAEAAALEGQSGVMAVFQDEIRYPQTDSTPEFLSLTDRGGAWASGYTGEDVVVGVIDTGIWPEHPSFSDTAMLCVNAAGDTRKPNKHGACRRGYELTEVVVYGPAPAGFTATTCDFGNTAFNPLDAPFTCNNKLLAAQSFGLGYHGGTGAGTPPGTYLSARDADGHGTHTASTAAGNKDVPATLLGSEMDPISGMAPRARISVYKACWDGCAVSDLVAAIDTAVADGVDVINYSIGSSSFTVGPDDISFLFAADAGVFVATSAGNAGPGAATVGSPASVPWLTAVGATTQSRTFNGIIKLGNHVEYTGTGIGITDKLPLVDAAAAGDELCNIGALNPAVVSGNIVLCKRGAIPLVNKSQAVLEAGGKGMILYNALDTQIPYLTTHAVPTVHTDLATGLAIKNYIAAAGSSATASIYAGIYADNPAPLMADFSSRGPNRLSSDIIKPDIAAPGFGILAAYTPTPFTGPPGELFGLIQGTSMSSPHVAGIFALLKQAHPDWSAAMAKSAMQTTAYRHVLMQDGVTPATPFDMGSGLVDPGGKALKPGSLFEPGIVYDAGLFEYAAFTCGANLGVFTSGTCAFLESIGVPTDPSNLNLATIGVGELVGSQTITRTITSVAKTTRTFKAWAFVSDGFDVTVSPNKIKLAPGESATFTVTITNDGTAVEGQWYFGRLEWESGNYFATSMIAVRPFAFAAPEEVTGTGLDGSASFDVQFGYNGNYYAAAHGLEAANLTVGNVADDPGNTFTPFGPGTTLHFVNVPAGSAYARFSLFDEFTDGADDLDLYVYYPNGTFAGSSGSGTSAEQVDVLLPPPGDYYVFVHGWQTDGPDSNYTLFNWAVSLTPGGSLNIDSAPTTGTVGATGTINVSWSGLAAGKYLGAVSHSTDDGLAGLTLVNVEN